MGTDKSDRSLEPRVRNFLSYNSFVRTTDPHHIKAVQEFWKICQKNGDIYKKNYKVKYCVGCELEKTDSELVDGKCPIHPNLELEIIDEENYLGSSHYYSNDSHCPQSPETGLLFDAG